jgi:hypothetical protein
MDKQEGANDEDGDTRRKCQIPFLPKPRLRLEQRVEFARLFQLRQADLRGSQVSGLNLAVLSDYAGLTISESEQSEILRQLGLDVRPD